MYFCGIDVAKRNHLVAIFAADGQVSKAPFAVSNTHQGYDQLHPALATRDGPVTIGLEAAVHYWLVLYDDLTRQACPVVVLNPLRIHAFRESGVRKVKHDHSDAVWIAEYLRFGGHRPADWPCPAGCSSRNSAGLATTSPTRSATASASC